MKDIDTQKIITVIQEALPHTLAIYLYGSFATGRNNSESDLDLAVFAKNPYSPSELSMARQKLYTNISTGAVDLVDLHKIPLSLAMEILRDGKPPCYPCILS